MRKLIYCLTALIAVSSCTDDDILEPQESKDEHVKIVQPSSRSKEDAIQIATYAASLKGSPTSRSANGAIVEDVVAITSSTSRAAADTLLYVVNYSDNQGYAVVSANTDCDALLAVTEQGHYVSEDEIENPGMKMFFQRAKSISGPQRPDRPLNPRRMEWVYDVEEDSVLPRVQVAYGSNPNYPRITCHAVAAAQALSMFEEPKSIVLTSENNTVLNINWYAFKHLNDPICSFAIDEHDRFMNELGFRMDNNPDYSIRFDKGHGVLKFLIPSHVFDIHHETPDVRGCIKNGGVLIMQGQAKDANGKLEPIGHVWIVDGYKYKYITDIEYIVTVDPDTGREISRELSYNNSHTATYLMHVNWGWNGIDNGYFSHLCFLPTATSQYDGSAGTDAPPYNVAYFYNYFYYLVR